MHVHLLVPDLLDPLLSGAGEPISMPSAELLYARGRVRSSPEPMESWLQARFGLPPGADAGLAAFSLRGDGVEPGPAEWMRADPVHLRVNADSMVLVDSSLFTLGREEAQSLADHLNAHFAPDFELVAAHPHRWYMRSGTVSRMNCNPLMEVRGGRIDRHLPQGGDAMKWQAVMNEVQMVLHGHPANNAREERGELPVNSLWFWGGGTPGRPDARPFDIVLSDDPLARGLGISSGAMAHALPGNAQAWLSQAPADGRALVVLDALRPASAYGQEGEWADHARAIELQWIAPMLAALREQHIGMLTLDACAAGRGRSVEVARSDLRRFWRRSSPLDSLIMKVTD